MNRAGVRIVRPAHAYATNYPQCVIVMSSTSSTVLNGSSSGRLCRSVHL